MASTNREIVEKYHEYMNNQQIDKMLELIDESAVFHGLDYVGLGINLDWSSGSQVYIKQVFDKSPSMGKLEVGDEIIRAKAPDRMVESFDDLKEMNWGRGKVGDQIQITIKRNGNLMDITILRGRVPAPQFPAREALMDMEKYADNLHYDLLFTIAEGDKVVTYATGTFHDKTYNMTVMETMCSIFRLVNGKIVEAWGINDEANSLRQLGYQINPPVKEKA